jgi:hypothetical protein
MKKSNSKNDFKNLKIKREQSSSSLNKNTQVLTPRSSQNNNTISYKSVLNSPSSQSNQVKVSNQVEGKNEFKRDLNFYIRQSSKPWAEIL